MHSWTPHHHTLSIGSSLCPSIANWNLSRQNQLHRNTCTNMSSTWSLNEALSDEVNLDLRICDNLVNLIDKDQCTLPFIAR